MYLLHLATASWVQLCLTAESEQCPTMLPTAKLLSAGSQRALLGNEVVADDSPSLHHELHLFEDADIGERIAFDRDQVRVVAGFERANLVRPAQQVGGVDGRRPNGLDGLHAPVDHLGELFGIVTVRIDTSVGPEGHLCARKIGPAEILAL